MGFLTGGDLDMPKGRLEHFLDWWVVLRSLLDGRSVHVPGSVEFHDPAGDPLDLRRAFPHRRRLRGDLPLPGRGRLRPPRVGLRRG
jgi:hypothetical protein